MKYFEILGVKDYNIFKWFGNNDRISSGIGIVYVYIEKGNEVKC